MAYIKKYATDAERRAALSRAAKSRKHNNGGRPKGARNKNCAPKIRVRTIAVRQPDYEVIATMAKAMDSSIIDFLHTAAEAWKDRNTELFFDATMDI